MVWCLFYTAVVSTWVGSLPAIFRIPILIGLLLLARPLLLLALSSWILILIFQALPLNMAKFHVFFPSGRPNSSLFLMFSFPWWPLPLVLVPLRYLADRLEGPQISFWHWLLVFGPLPLLLIWLVARIRRKQEN